MVVTRNQSRFLQYPSSGNMHPEWKLRSSGVRVGGNSGIGNHSKGIANNGDDGARARKLCGRPGPAQEDSTLATFLAETSIHGVKYISQENRHWTERLFWVVAFLLGISSSAYLIYGVWDRYQQTPVIVTFDVNEIDTSSIPFPAVTICDVNPISKRLVDELELALKQTNSSDPKHVEAEEKLEFVRRVCFEYRNTSRQSRSLHAEDIIGFLINNTDPCDEMIKWCRFNQQTVPCSSVFKPKITRLGKCCTFNHLPLGLLFMRPNKTGREEDNEYGGRVDEFVEAKYLSKPVGIHHWSQWQPKKQWRAGARTGLSLLIESKPDDYHCPFGYSEGHRIDIHSPFDAIVRKWMYPTVVHLGKETFFGVNADITKADSDIRNYSQEKRKCYFENETQLKYHQPYTTTNCVMECFTVNFARDCGCTWYNMPNYHPEYTGIRICASEDFPCLGKSELNVIFNITRMCPGCDPLCEDTQYTYSMSMGNLMSPSQKLELPVKGFETEERRRNAALVHVYFESQTYIPKLRKALYGWTDLIGNTGGILGLCLGFSVISAIELFYFFTIRIACSKHRQRVPVRNRSSIVSSIHDSCIHIKVVGN